MAGFDLTPWPTDITEAQQKAPIFTEETSNAYPMSPEGAERLSYMAHYGLANILRKSQKEIYGDLTYGGEADMRAMSASALDVKKSLAIQNALSEIAKKRPDGLLKNEDFDFVQKAIGNLNKETDPDTVFEQTYAKEYMNALDRAGIRMGSDYSYAAAAAPKYHELSLEAGAELGAKTAWLDTLYERTKTAYEQQSWGGWAVDRAKEIGPFYSIAKSVGRGPEGGASIFVGSNWEKTSEDYYKLPLDQFKVKTSADVEAFARDNPGKALDYIEALKGQSSNQRLFNTVLPIVDTATAPGIGFAYKATRAIFGSAKTAEQIAKGATETMLKELNSTTSHTPVNVASATGDLKEAASLKATAETAANLKDVSTPTRQIFDQLATTPLADNADMLASPGRFGQENVNRFIETTQNLTDRLFTGLLETLRVNRLGDAITTETTVRAIMDHIANTYGGLRNRVLSIGKPELEPASNTWFVRMTLGDGGAVYFPTRKAAELFAKEQGLSDVKIFEKAGADVTTQAPREFTPQEIGKMQEKMKNYEKAADFINERTQDLSGLKAHLQNNLDELRTEYFEKIRTASNQRKLELRSEWEGKAKGIQKDIRELDNVIKTREVSTPVQSSIKQQGVGWYVEKIVPVDETVQAVRDAIRKEVETEGSKAFSPKSFINDWFGRFRTPEETLSLAQRENRKIVTYSPSIFREIIKESLDEVKQLKGYWPKQKWEDWQRIVKHGQDIPDENGLKGKFFKSPHELETEYQTLLGRLPDEQEVRAYFAFKRTMEYDRMFRNLAVHRNMLRLGAELHEFFTLTAEGVRVGGGKFAGVLQAGIPGGEGNLLLVGDKLGDESVHALSPAFRKKWEEAVAKGEYRVIEVYDPEAREFAGFGDKIGNSRIRYVMAKNTETEALNINHVPRRGGGHIEYDYNHYLKQAKIRWDEVSGKHFYEGDITLMGIPIPQIGKEVLTHINKVRELLKAKDEIAAELYAKEHLSIKWDELRGWFHAQPDETGVVKPPRLSLDEPIMLVQKDKNILQTEGAEAIMQRVGADHNTFRDGTKSGSLARQFTTQFTEERDADKLLAATVEGTTHNPLYKLSAAETIDPITTMNRALNRIITTNFFDDYKISAVEHWLAEAGKYLDVNPSVLMHSPFWHFNNALTMFKVGADKNAVARLKTQHMQIQQLLGIPSEADSFIESAAQKLADAVYSSTGKTVVLDPKRDLPFLTDPVRFIRGAVFHANLGFFNIPQFIVQSMNYVNMTALAPKTALSGTYAAQLHFWSRINSHPNIIEHLDKLASSFRMPGLAAWKPGEFKQAMEELAKTGFGNVGREYAVLDDIMREKYITSAGRDILDAGTMFFKGGERNARYGAWYTAFKEWKDANPFKKITNADRADILERADLLNMNMSRASNSTLHQGIWSIPTQFLTYQLRVAELFFGTRLGKTTGERMLNRARLVGTNAAMFGIPTALGVTAMPFTDSIRTYALENGYVVGDNFLSSLAMEGIPALIVALVTGQGDIKKGVWYNFQDRYGTKGFESVNNLMRSDKTFWDIFGGAAFSKLSSTWAATDGLRNAMFSILRNDDKYFPLKIEDFMDVFKEISSVNSAWRMIGAINTGRWMSKNEGYITDVSPFNAIVSTLTGLQDQKTSDVYRLSQSLNSQQDLEKFVEKQFIQEFRRFLKNSETDNDSEAQRNLTRARAFLKIGGYPEDKYKDVIQMAIRDNKSLVDRIDLQFYMDHAPDAVKKVRREAFRTKLNMKDN